MPDSSVNLLRNKSSETTSKGLERAQAILAEARIILATEGDGALTMRSVAQRAGVRLSTVQHYYPNREALIEALLVNTMQNYQRKVEQLIADHSEEISADPYAQFKAVIDHFLLELRDQVSSGMFFEISAMANRHPNGELILSAMLTSARKNVRNLIRSAQPEFTQLQCEARGALVIAQLIGMMLFISDVRPLPYELNNLEREASAAIMRIAFGT
jgi:AcrR family transcriptional regulator